jgi:FtsZ-binding cell division protein ZapB
MTVDIDTMLYILKSELKWKKDQFANFTRMMKQPLDKLTKSQRDKMTEQQKEKFIAKKKNDEEYNTIKQLAYKYATLLMERQLKPDTDGESSEPYKEEITTFKIENEGLKSDVERLKKRNKEVAYQYRNWKSETNALNTKISDLQKELEIFKQRTIITENELWKLGHKKFNNLDGKEYKFYSKGTVLDDSSDEEDVIDDVNVYGVITEEQMEKAKQEHKKAMTTDEPPPIRYDKMDDIETEEQTRKSMSNMKIEVGIPKRD